MLMGHNLPNGAQPNEGRTQSGRPSAAGRLTTPIPPPRHREGPVFRRTSKTESARPDLPERGPGPKGRPTPTRKEAEAAARQRAKTTMDKMTAQQVLRERRTESNAKVREGMRTGDERYLPARDKGPVKRFIRDYVDARLSIAEFLLPVLVAIMVLQYSQNARMIQIGSALMSTTLLVVALDTSWLLFRIKRAIRAK